MMNKNILVVEDDATLNKVYSEKFGQEGFGVTIAVTAKEAITKLANDTFDLVILDIMLPGEMNGFDVLEKMKQEEKLKKIPVIVLTNLDSEEKTAREIGANVYLVKADTKIEDVVSKVKSFF